MRSVWGSKVDRWFDAKTGARDVRREDYDRAGVRWLVIAIGLAVLSVVLIMIDRIDDANF